jgi:hypothetical protein
LPYNVVFVIVFEDQQVFFEGFSGLAFLQELFRALNALADLGSVQSSCDLRHAESGGVNPAPILGVPTNPSNAVTPDRDYEGHPLF